MSAVIGMNLHHQTGGYIPNLPDAVMRFSLFTNSHPGACWEEDDAQTQRVMARLEKPPGGPTVCDCANHLEMPGFIKPNWLP
jgi:hypothetical protein